VEFVNVGTQGTGAARWLSRYNFKAPRRNTYVHTTVWNYLFIGYI